LSQRKKKERGGGGSLSLPEERTFIKDLMKRPGKPSKKEGEAFRESSKRPAIPKRGGERIYRGGGWLLSDREGGGGKKKKGGTPSVPEHRGGGLRPYFPRGKGKKTTRTPSFRHLREAAHRGGESKCFWKERRERPSVKKERGPQMCFVKRPGRKNEKHYVERKKKRFPVGRKGEGSEQPSFSSLDRRRENRGEKGEIRGSTQILSRRWSRGGKELNRRLTYREKTSCFGVFLRRRGGEYHVS